MAEKKELTGGLFKNDKNGNEKAPDYKGNCLIDGNEYQISSWINTAKDGSKYMSLKFEVKVSKAVTPTTSGEMPF